MPGRTWVIAPDADSFARAGKALIDAPSDQKEALFHPHLEMVNQATGTAGGRGSRGLPGYEPQAQTRRRRTGDPVSTPIRYGFRSFDRQWIIPDNRLINQPNPELWEAHSDRQVYLTASARCISILGSCSDFHRLIPDLHHYNGRGGRVFPSGATAKPAIPNMPEGLLNYLGQKYRTQSARRT